MAKKQTPKTQPAKVILPPHLQAMADKWQKMIDNGEAKPIVVKYTVTDVTPKGYGPSEE